MSRNVRNKSSATPPKKSARRRSTTVDDSSDDDYEGVNLISDDSDDDEPDVDEAEAQMIIHDEDDDDLQTTPRPTQDDEISWDGFDEDQEVLGDGLPFFDEHMARTAHATEATLFPDSDGEPGTRRVRFDLSDSPSTISNDDDDEFDDEYPFPELFVDQSKLDPSFRRQIEDDRDEDRASSDGGFWDLHSNLENPIQEVVDEIDDSTSDSSSGTDESGYETDDGETTEEEALPKQRFVPARSVLRQPSSESESEEEETFVRRANPRTPRAGDLNGPQLGSFEQKPTRPFAVIDLKSKRLLMFKAKINRRHSFNDAPLLPTNFVQENTTTLQEMSPMISNSANMMMSAMYNPMGQFLGGEVLGPPEAFFPFTSISVNGDITQDSPSSFDDDDIDEVDVWAMEDLIDYPGEETTDEADEPDDSGSPTDGEIFSTPRPTTATSEDQVHPLLLSNPRLVGAFRNNQDTHRLLSGSNATADSMRFASRFNTTAIQGIRNGHLNAATTSITPVRKQRPLPPMDSSPLAAQQNKRKFSGEDRGHKRTKSMN